MTILQNKKKNSCNWTNKVDEKLLDLLIEPKAQGTTQFEWPLVKALLKKQGKSETYNDMLKKLKTWKWLIGGTGVGNGVDSNTGAVKVTDDA